MNSSVFRQPAWLMLLAAGVYAAWAGCRPTDSAVLPARVVSGSMAEHFWGEHWEVMCGDCGFAFRCGTEHPPTGMQAICPNCGFAENEVHEDGVQPGRAVSVVPRDFEREPPRRWEILAFDEPGSDHVAVKRVVGLPGESVSIRGGDVYVDGRRLQKSCAQFAAVAQPVYDPHFPSRTSKAFGERWRPQHENSAWQEVADADNRGTFQCNRRERNAENTDVFDWLIYHHRNTATPVLRDAKARILDNYGYNQGLSRPLNAMADVAVRGIVDRLSDGGEFRIRLLSGERPLEIALVPQENTVRLYHGEKELAQSPASAPMVGNSAWAFTAGIVDGRVMVRIDGVETLAFDLEAARLAVDPSDVSIGLGNRGLNVRILAPTIVRDIYYLNPDHRAEDWELQNSLGQGEYFLLGDNPPNSHDCRHYGPVPKAALRGSVPSPAKSSRQRE